MSVLITGATGFLGSRVLRRLLDDGADETITVLGRGAPGQLRHRIEAVLEAAQAAPPPPGALERLRYVESDLTKPGLGLSRRETAEATGGLTAIWHCAAGVALQGDPGALFKTNIGGTRAVLELADEAPDAHLFHTSTAYVAGRRRLGHIMEDDLSEEAGFQTYYEETKFNGERLIHAWAARTGRAVTIMRPSLLVLDQVIPDGLPSQSLNPVTRLIDAGLTVTDDAGATLRRDIGTLHIRLRADPEGSLNMLQVDYAAHAMVRAAAHRGTGVRTIHITHPHNTSMGVLMRAFEHAYPGLVVEIVTTLPAPTPYEAQVDEQLTGLAAFTALRRTYDRTNLLRAVDGLPDPDPIDSAYLARSMKNADSVVGA
ncbi:SDR family oxidoreductase [Streptomyces sp. H27-D2]|uniref:SDR family oxidoreductase n=1 Tax=Streptomyces sp. H27-D2 TaxID=3046304 RepID=UPI002DBA614F|nr:SDR family oxidoreductase [Streptomyces sp. H27-D2]MEC4016289.1 SDR family oxidoreductase [Streptomyces sp. H27-D2]